MSRVAPRILLSVLWEAMIFECLLGIFWFLVLLFQRRGQFRLILPLLLLKPPRLTKARTEMMPKFLEKKAALLCHLPLLILESQA
jgi:hypothetical protein